MSKYIILFLIISSPLINNIEAVQVLPAPPNPWGEVGGSLGKGFSQGMALGLAQKKKEREQKKIQEEEAKRNAREKAILENILKDYDHSKHDQYILKIIQSDLSHETKSWVSDVLNEQHNQYLKEQKKGIWSWLFQK